MQTIEINTTQNVAITYEIASTQERILAYLIDIVIILISVLIASIFSGVIAGKAGSTGTFIFYLVVIPIFFFYSLVSELITNGESIGKRAMNIKAVKLNGNEPSADDFVLRWVFRMIDIYFSIGTLAIIFIGSSRKGQRIGDLIAETSVIKIKPVQRLKLQDIMKISSLDNHEVTYPEIVRFSEDDMLLIKNTLDRSIKYKNRAHSQALLRLSQKVKNKLSTAKDSHAPPEQFLTTLLKDYIVLTR